MSANNTVKVGSTVLLLNDLQLAIISGSPLASSEPEAIARAKAAVDQCARALASARRAGMTVIHARVEFPPGHPEANPNSPMMRFIRDRGLLVEGDSGTRFDPRVAPVKDEIVVTKHGVSAFAGTTLDQLLRARGVNTVALGGLVTHYGHAGSP